MPYALIRHRVQDYASWRPGFDAHSKARLAAGGKAGRVFQVDGDPNHLLILFEWDSLDDARAFAASDELREAMARAGVVDKPDFYYLNDVT